MISASTPRLMRITLCVVIGVVSTIVVGWGFAMWGDRLFDLKPSGTIWSQPGPPRSVPDDGWTFWIERAPGTLRIFRLPVRFSFPEILPATERRVAPWWSAVHEPVPSVKRWRTIRMTFDEVANGWPCHALLSERESTLVSSPSLEQGVEQSMLYKWSVHWRTQREGLPVEIRLPLRPIWPGFVFNTLFYGAMAFAFLFGPGIVRRAIRQRRGACVRCGYDLRGMAGEGVCPECGGINERRRGGEDVTR